QLVGRGLDAQLGTRPLGEVVEVARAVHRAGDRVLDVVEAEGRARVGVGDVDVADALFLDRLRHQVVAKARPLRRCGALSVLHHPPRLSSVKTSLATAFNVSKTPSPDAATAGNSTTRVGLRSCLSSSSGAELGRSRLLYCTTYGSLSRL